MHLMRPSFLVLILVLSFASSVFSQYSNILKLVYLKVNVFTKYIHFYINQIIIITTMTIKITMIKEDQMVISVDALEIMEDWATTVV